MTNLAELFPTTTERTKLGRLQVAGLDLAELAHKWGTPLYIYDAATVKAKIHNLDNLLQTYYPGISEISYAAKAYFSFGMACRLAGLGVGVDVVSLGELKIAKKAGFKPEKVHLHGNNKSEAELLYALEWGIESIVLDSLEEIEFLNGLLSYQKNDVKVWLRITPGVTVDTHPYRQTGHSGSKFGFSLQDGQAAEAIRRINKCEKIHLAGLHMHLGSQVFDAEPYQRAISLLAGLAGEQDFVPETLSPGGGWGVPYTYRDELIDASEWVRPLSEAVTKESKERGWPLPRLILEPGRWLVAQSGVALYTVGSTKYTGDGDYIVALDGGMADNPRPALYQANYEAELVERTEAAPKKNGSLVGKFCETGDKLIPEAMLPEMHRGEILAMPVSGAYQLSMASNYNLAPRPAVLWLESGRVEVLQHREEPDENGWWMSGMEL
ncbi:MAG: diaminopimelate decarboxylase [Anaerolineaceae bacterium]|nr:diaminopimelate decarboxylase [Anaerolineaceae bacterium]